MTNPTHNYVVGVIAVIAALTALALFKTALARRNRARIAAVHFTSQTPAYAPAQQSTYRPSYPNALYGNTRRSQNFDLPQYTPPPTRPAANNNTRFTFNHYPRNPSFNTANASVPVYQPPRTAPPSSPPQPVSPSYSPSFPIPRPAPAPAPSPSVLHGDGRSSAAAASPSVLHGDGRSTTTPASPTSPSFPVPQPQPPSPNASKLRKSGHTRSSSALDALNGDGRSPAASAAGSLGVPLANGDGRGTALWSSTTGEGGPNGNSSTDASSRPTKLRKPASAGAMLNVVNVDGRSVSVGDASASRTGGGGETSAAADAGPRAGSESIVATAGGLGPGRPAAVEPSRPASPPPAYSEGQPGDAYMDGRD